MNRAYFTELDPNRTQREMLKAHADAARFVWNWGLERKKTVIDLNRLPIERIRMPTAIDLHRELNDLKAMKFPWLYNVSKCVGQEALRDLDKAFEHLWKGRAGFPWFKSKKWAKKSFHLNGNCPTAPRMVEVSGRYIKLPKIGWIKVEEAAFVPEDAKISSITISERAGRWFVSVQVREERAEPKPVDGPTVGIDAGVGDDLLVIATPDGEIERVKNPRVLRSNERKLRRLQRRLSRKQPGSKNREKARLRVQRHHFKITNVRKDALHKATTALARVKSIIVVEDLSVRAMMGNHHVAKSFADAGLSETVRLLEYKTAWYGSRLLKADRFYPSSQICSNCRRIHPEMTMEGGFAPVLLCECGRMVDRNENAAINLSRWPSVRRTLETPAETARTAKAGSVIEAGTAAA